MVRDIRVVRGDGVRVLGGGAKGRSPLAARVSRAIPIAAAGGGARRRGALASRVAREVSGPITAGGGTGGSGASGGGARGGGGSRAGVRPSPWWGSHRRVGAAAFVVVAVPTARRWARWARGWCIEGIVVLLTGWAALAGRWRWPAGATGGSGSGAGRGGGARDEHPRGSDLKLAKEGARLPLPPAVASPLSLGRLGGDLAEIVAGRVDVGPGGEGGGAGGGHGAEEMAVGAAEALPELLRGVGGGGDADRVVGIEVGDGGGGTLGELLGIVDALAGGVLGHVARERGWRWRWLSGRVSEFELRG